MTWLEILLRFFGHNSHFWKIIIACIVLVETSAIPIFAANWEGNKDWGFVIRTEEEVTNDPGLLMVCPSHDHGSTVEALEKLKELRRNYLSHNPKVPTKIWICRMAQRNTCEFFGNQCDIVILNPYASLRFPKWWSGEITEFEHPILRNIRHAISCAEKGHVWVCVPLSGEESFLKKKLDYEELKWTILAAVGSGCKGIVYRGTIGSLPELSTLNALLMRLGPLLSMATPTDMERLEISGEHIIPLITHVPGKAIIITLLNRGYLNRKEDDKIYTEHPVQSYRIRENLKIVLPEDFYDISVRNLQGATLPYGIDKKLLNLPINFNGSGEVIVIQRGR